MTRIAVVFGSLVASTAAYAANLLQDKSAAQNETGYMPFPWDDDPPEC